MIARPYPLAGRTSPWFRLRIAGFLVVSLATFLPCVSHAQKPIPAGPDARTEEGFRKIKYEWLIREMVTPYDRVGKKNPQYDDKVRAFLKDFCFDSLWPDGAFGNAKLKQSAEEILKAGCEDPLFLRAYACLLPDDSDPALKEQVRKKALDGFLQGSYPHINTFYAALNSYPSDQPGNPAKKQLRAYCRETGVKALADAIKAGEFGPGEQQIAYRLAAFTCEVFGRPRWTPLYTLLNKQGDTDPWLLGMIAGEMEVAAAWEARSGATADKVTEEGWKGFRAHLTRAYAALTPAWKLQPQYPEAPALMITVAMGGAKGMGEDERTWFDRAVAAQMDYGPPYDHLLWALRPRWGGSYKEMYLFGLECLNTKRFDTGVPMWYLNALKDISSEYPEDRWHEAYQQPKIDECLDQLFDGMLKVSADKPRTRDLLLAQSAFAAIWCGEFEKAKSILAKVQSKDVSFPANFFHRRIAPEHADQKIGETTLRALTSAQGNLLLDSWALCCKGSMAKAKPLLEKALEETKGDRRVYSYALDRYGFLLLSEKTGQKTTPATGGSALYACAQANQTPLVELLLGKGADVNADNGSGWTPLHIAIEKGHTDLAHLLLNKGAKVDTVTLNGQTPLLTALRSGMSEIAWRVMKNGADINVAGPDGWTPLHMALRYGCVDAATNLIVKGADLRAKTNSNWTPLLFALQHGHFQIAQYLIEQGVDYDVVNVEGWAALHMALQYGRPDLAKRMIEKGANVNILGDQHRTPLHYAVFNNHTEIAKILIEKGANVNAQTLTEGSSPFHLAALKGDLDILKIMSDKGADLNKPDSKGMTALMYALGGEQRNAALFLIGKGVDLHALNQGKDNALHYAAQQGYVDVIRLLLEQRVDRNIKDKDGETPLDIARKFKHPEAAEILSKP